MNSWRCDLSNPWHVETYYTPALPKVTSARDLWIPERPLDEAAKSAAGPAGKGIRHPIYMGTLTYKTWSNGSVPKEIWVRDGIGFPGLGFLGVLCEATLIINRNRLLDLVFESYDHFLLWLRDLWFTAQCYLGGVEAWDTDTTPFSRSAADHFFRCCFRFALASSSLSICANLANLFFLAPLWRQPGTPPPRFMA